MDLYLSPGSGYDVWARRGPNRDATLRLRPAAGNAYDISLYSGVVTVVVVAEGEAFPTQYAGLRFFSGTVQELCLVALGDGSGGVRIVKNGVTYNAYLVDTSDPHASGVRVQTGAGVKAIRLKT